MAKVLIVDDERSIRATLAEFVREDGHDVRTAQSAGEALQAIAEDVPDVVVTDIILPHMSGVELLARLHESHPDVQAIMITGEPTVETAVEAVRQGAFDYLPKPVSSTAVRSAVARCARVKQLADDRRRLEEENRTYREHLEEEVERRGRALRESEERHRAVVENAVEGIVVVQGGLVRFANQSAFRLCGYAPDALLDAPLRERVLPEDRARFEEERVDGEGDDAHLVRRVRFERGDGQVRWLEFRPVRFEWDGAPATLHFLRDVTDEQDTRRRQAERQRRIELHSRAIVELAMEPALYAGNLDAALGMITEVVADLLNVERVELWLAEEGLPDGRCAELFERSQRRHSRGRSPSLTIHPVYSAALRSERAIVAFDALHDPRTAEFVEPHFAPLGIGAVIDVGVRLGGQVVGIFSVEHVGGPRNWPPEAVELVNAAAELVTVAIESARQRETERALERSETEYRSLFEDSPVSLFVEDFSGIKMLFDSLRRAGIRDLDAYLSEHPETVDLALRSIRVLDANEAAVRLHGVESKDALLQNVTRDYPPSALAFFRDRLLAIWRGDRVFETTSDDRTLDGRPLHVALRWSIPPGQTDSLGRVLLAKTDITALVEGERKVRRALDGAIEAIGRVTEARDPYTAGHQRRVTALSVAIAERLGFEAARIEATRAAGLLHDIGKLAIPAEILSKPSILSPLEMSLMRTHPESAYEVLRTIEFPWPVADIVLQHHERIDGSGYPVGLKGEKILAEARILAVADVVEAMSSHRPYRAALGVEAALAEAERGRGTLYDADAVDACVRLFREGAFTFPSA